jgi:conjugative relaxase-like TrwC/TraI family protein
MLSIGRLAAGGQAYYLATVASGVEDYYVGRGGAPGRWLGRLAVDLGVDGRVDGEVLHTVLEGRDPSDGARLCRTRSDRTPGFDLCFRAPKSVSILFGLGGHETALEVRAAHDSAVGAALGYLERTACWARRGTNGIDQISADGFVAAAFRHRTSRAGDPHLHTHVLVANVTRADDGRWSSLDARHLYLHAKTAGFLYEAHLRDDLTRRLGVAWGPVRNGIADLDGIPDSVLKLFSKRRAEIEAEMARRGVTSARAAEIATLETRHTKALVSRVTFGPVSCLSAASSIGLMIPVLAQMMDRGDMNNGGGHWWAWLIGLAVLGIVIVLVVWMVTRLAQPHSASASAPPPSRPSAEDVLADRLARGEIDEDEYRRRRDALRT